MTEKFTIYFCRNGAFHDTACNEHCWNTHPLATKGEMFMISEKCEEIQRENFIKKAMKSGFTKNQAVFLSKVSFDI